MTCDIFGSDLSSQQPQSRRGKVHTDIVFSFFCQRFTICCKENKVNDSVFTLIGPLMLLANGNALIKALNDF